MDQQEEKLAIDSDQSYTEVSSIHQYKSWHQKKEKQYIPRVNSESFQVGVQNSILPFYYLLNLRIIQLRICLCLDITGRIVPAQER